MNDILSFTTDMAARPGYKRFLYKMEGANAIKAVDTQLTHAFQVFQVGSAQPHCRRGLTPDDRSSRMSAYGFLSNKWPKD